MKITIFLAILMISQAASSQDPAKAQDPKAEPFLNNIADNFQSSEAYQIEFRYEVYSAQENAKVGDFGSLLVKDNKYKLKTEDSEVIFNGTHMWVYNNLSAEVYKSKPEPGETDQTLADPFRLLGNYKKYYKYRYKGIKKIGGIPYEEIDLYPVNIESEYSYVRILCSEGGSKLYSLSLRQKNGTEIRAYISEIVRSVNVPDSVFSWNSAAYPDVLLIEM